MKLSRLIAAVWKRVPFYSRHWRHLGEQLASMQFPEQLHELPVVRKSDLLAQSPHELLDGSYQVRDLSVEKTSGSSGQPLQIYKDRATARRRGLRFLRAMICCGYRPGQRVLLISTRRSGGVMRFARWKYADVRDEALLQEFQQIRPDVLYGPLTSLLQICEHAGAASALHRPSVVISTAEQMSQVQRAVLETTFNCRVADFYGMTEVGLVAFRRPAADTYEMASQDLILEYLAADGDHSAERLIVTDTTGGAMPLIRYDTGDLVHRELRGQTMVVCAFHGRRVDSITLPSGRMISPYRVTLCLEDLPQLRQYQVVQREDMSLDVYFNSDERHTESVRQDIFTALARLCPGLPARIRFQNHALHKAAGKFRPVQSELRASA